MESTSALSTFSASSSAYSQNAHSQTISSSAYPKGQGPYSAKALQDLSYVHTTEEYEKEFSEKDDKCALAVVAGLVACFAIVFFKFFNY